MAVMRPSVRLSVPFQQRSSLDTTRAVPCLQPVDAAEQICLPIDMFISGDQAHGTDPADSAAAGPII